MDTYIFGAKATAAGLYRALSVLDWQSVIKAFLVSKLEGNVPEIWGIPVRDISEAASGLSDGEKDLCKVYAAVPELVHKEIRTLIEGYGFRNPVMLDSRMETDIMERYFRMGGRFKSVHALDMGAFDTDIPKLTIYAASFYKDKPLEKPPERLLYIRKLFLGCDSAERNGVDITGKAEFYDNTGDNISDRNLNRCEMTAHYWIWKNRLDTDDEYVGVCHYRRTLDLSDDDLKKMKGNDVDVVLPYPMIHYPSARIHHTWYVPEADWKLAKQVVNELYPEYGAKWNAVFDSPEFYNYNMMLAKKDVFADYCAWLFPILDRIEELSSPKGNERHDRYTAYLSESLETLYFMTNINNLKIFHTGRLLYT